MNEYVVVYFESFKKYVKFKEFKDLKEAVEYGNELKRSGKDVVIVKRVPTVNRRTRELEYSYKIEKFGYYKVYNFINKILILFFFMIIAFFCYLYFKFFKK